MADEFGVSLACVSMRVSGKRGLYKERPSEEEKAEKRKASCDKWSRANPEKRRASGRAWRGRNPESVKRKWQRSAKQQTPESRILNSAKQRAKKKALPFALQLSDIVIPPHCPILGLPLLPSRTGRIERNDGSPSLDRIDSAKGYTPDNVWVISWRANDLKGNATLAELRALVAAMEKLAC